MNGGSSTNHQVHHHHHHQGGTTFAASGRFVTCKEMVHEQSSGGHHHHQQALPRYAGAAAATGVARASKKNKPKKIPQRGLGVAQLEKLRIEEQKKMEGAAAAMSGAAHSHALGGLGQLLPMHHPPPPPPPPLALSGALPRPVADGAVHCGFSPVLWDPADPMKLPYKTSLCPQPPLPTVSTGLSLTAPSSHPTEPPSNQMYSSSGTRSSAAAPPPADDDREAAGVDRSWPFMFEGMGSAAFRTTSKAPFATRTTRQPGLPDVCPDLSRYEFRATNYFSTNANYSDWASEFAHGKGSKENGCTGEPAYLTLNAQPAPLMKQPHLIPSIHLPEFSDFGVMHPQASESEVLLPSFAEICGVR
ncbi:hypothetical protein U9M48_021184 [Paspalum notatum var. saurae]|uniref:Uncharacterized protein n=1 Tax=Paspalum notatum var. saurae TaxID=547442 RepID=A0AAQ3WTB6_PASNO